VTEFKNDNIKAIAFDVDGTLFSSENIILDTYIESIQNFVTATSLQIEIPTKEKILEQVGLPVKEIFKNLLPFLKEDQRDSISDNVLKLLCEKIESKKGTLYEGVLETVSHLSTKEYLLFIASNGRAPYINSILNTYGLKKYFGELVVINYSTIRSKGDILKSYIKRMNLAGKNILMVGDRISDLDAALENNSPFAFCEFGHAEKGEVNTYDIALKNMSDLLKHL
jgi:phosphoglycolate phosphatase